ncbi:MAG: ABC transporter permease [Saprospiraceae bacterium]|nr:ABC transporter permease [Lewinella sp.]
MLRNNLKLILRQFWKNRTFSLINVLGLTLGTACCLYILFYAMEQYQYDLHQQDLDELYRVVTDIPREQGAWHTATISPPIVPALAEDFPEVETWTRLVGTPDVSQQILKWKNTTFYETKGYYVDSSFFEVFTYNWVEGRPDQALAEPYTVVLTLPVAERLFGRQSAVGEAISIGDNEFRVTGVVDPAGMPSHIRGHYYMSLKSGGVGDYVSTNNNWAGNNFIHAYVKLKPNVDAAAVEARFPDFLARHGADQLSSMGMEKSIYLEPVRDIHIFSDRENQVDTTVSSSLLYILLTIAGFIQFLACINFMNLTTARSTLRAKEVGIRKTVGANRAALTIQFLTEAVMLAVIAFLLAIPLIKMILPWLNQMTGSEVTASLTQYPLIWGIIGALVLLTGIVAGSYPAFYLSGFQAVNAFKANSGTQKFSVARVRKGLVVLQFAVSVGLVIGAVLIHQQLNYIQNRDLGFQKEQQILLPLRTESAREGLAGLKQQLRQLPGVRAVSGMLAAPGQFVTRDFSIYTEGKNMDSSMGTKIVYTDEDYMDALSIPLLAGRELMPSDTNHQIILNRTAIETLGLDISEAPGTEVYSDFDDGTATYRIVGVMEDFNFQSLRSDVQPLMLRYWPPNENFNAIVSTSTKDYGGLLAMIEQKWNSINPNTPFEYTFLDENLQKQYQAEANLANIISLFTFLAIFISCMGLFGLATFTIERKVKEIGIRKVLGATTVGLVGRLSTEFMVLVGSALIVAVPLAWYFMNQWLDEFAYHVPIRWWVFVLVGGLAVGLAFLTVSVQAVRAALANPVEAIKSE